MRGAAIIGKRGRARWSLFGYDEGGGTVVMMRIASLPNILCALVLCAILGALAIPGASESAEPPREPLTIISAGNAAAEVVHNFAVEVARTPPEQAEGLMFRKSLAPDHGMLFIHEEVARRSMWMKNTLIPLDMLFIAADGVIAHIVERTTPLSTDTISSRAPVLAVLELRGGTVARLDVKRGDRVRHAAFE